MNYTDKRIYYIIDENGDLVGYWFGGVLSRYFCQSYGKYLTKKYPEKKFYYNESWLSIIIEFYEGKL